VPSASKILATLPTLSKPDLAQIRAAADSLLGPTAAPNKQAATPLFDAMTRALGLRLGFETFRATATYKPYMRGEEAVTLFIAQHFPAVCDSRVTYNAVLSFMVECLMDDLKERKVPLSIGTLCNNLERAPQVLKAAFPGYMEGGLSSVILNQITNGRI
jgi:hypothetical protein